MADELSSKGCKETLETLSIRITFLEKQVALQINVVRDNIAVILAASEKSITKSEIENEKRFESVNEFRATLSDQQRTLLPRTEYIVQHKAISDRIDQLEILTRDYRGKFSGSTATI